MLEPAAREEGARLDERLDHGLVRVALLPFVRDDAQALEARALPG